MDNTLWRLSLSVCEFQISWKKFSKMRFRAILFGMQILYSRVNLLFLHTGWISDRITQSTAD